MKSQGSSDRRHLILFRSPLTILASLIKYQQNGRILFLKKLLISYLAKLRRQRHVQHA